MIYQVLFNAFSDGGCLEVFVLDEDDFEPTRGYRRECLIGRLTVVSEQFGEPCEPFYRGYFDTVQGIEVNSAQELADYIRGVKNHSEVIITV